MKVQKMLVAAVLMLGVAMLGCSDDTNVTPDTFTKQDGGTADQKTADQKTADQKTSDQKTVDQKTSDSSGTGVTITGTFTDFIAKTAVAGVKVCVEGMTTGCATSDAKGAYSITGPSGKDFNLTMVKTGYLSFLAPYGKGQKDKTYDVNMLSDGTVTLMTALLGTTKKAGKSTVIITVSDGTSGVAGTTLTLAPPSGEGPYYMNASGTGPDKTLTATSTSGYGFVLNADPGSYVGTFANTSKTCTIGQGWAGASAGKTNLKLIADHATFFSLVCK